MSRTLTVSMTLLAMIAFAGNSLLCRLAMQHTSIDPASFTTIRLLSGALMLWLIVRMRDGMHSAAGSWPSALALFAYAAGFSYAYVSPDRRIRVDLGQGTPRSQARATGSGLALLLHGKT